MRFSIAQNLNAMKVLIMSVVLLLCCMRSHSQAHPIQKPSLRGQKPYFVKDQYYNFKELKFLLQNDPQLSKFHRAGVRNDVIAKVFGYSTLGLWAVGVSAFVIDDSPAEVLNTGGALGVILIVLVSPITGTIGLIANSFEVYYKNRTIEDYNKMYRDKFGREIEYPKLGLAKTGIGISISF